MEIFIADGVCDMKKLCVLICALMLFLSGCGASLTADMFAVPEMPEMHKALIESVDTVLADGFEFSNPRSGINREPLQLIDLDGDGESEGVAFLRDVLETHKTFIYVFEMTDDGFKLFDIIEGTEQELYTVSYTDVLGGEGYEIIVEWGTALEEAHSVTIYNQTISGMEKLIEFTAESYCVADLDRDGTNEFIASVDRNGSMFADIYGNKNGTFRISDSVPLSEGGERAIAMKSGKVTESLNAVFSEREYSDGVITDVIAYIDGEYVNILTKDNICESRVLCADINGDGITDIPKRVQNGASVGASDSCYRWENINPEGGATVCAFTYHSFTDNWYMTMPKSWMTSVNTKSTVYGTGRLEIEFFTRERISGDVDDYLEAELFTITVLRGDAAKSYREEDGKFEIYRRDDAVFCAEIMSDSYLGIGIDKEFFDDAFRIRESEWASEILFA